jgi:alkyl hydroperoxide reductase subunit AhpC
LADFNPKGGVASLFGLYLEEKGFTARATVIVDRSGKIAYVKVQELGQARDDNDILRTLEALK